MTFKLEITVSDGQAICTITSKESPEDKAAKAILHEIFEKASAQFVANKAIADKNEDPTAYTNNIQIKSGPITSSEDTTVLSQAIQAGLIAISTVKNHES